MIRQTLLAAAFATLASAALAEITYDGGDGTTIEAAVVITGAQGSSDGVKAEYQWIGKNRPGAEVLGQALAQNGDRYYDVITIRTGDRTEELYFDITGFFGQF